jgi:hypothetical protein
LLQSAPSLFCPPTSNSLPQAGRGHLKQLLSDLEGEQERAAGLAAALDDARAKLVSAEGCKEVAEARLVRAQKQVAVANEAAAELEAKNNALAAQLKVGVGGGRSGQPGCSCHKRFWAMGRGRCYSHR